MMNLITKLALPTTIGALLFLLISGNLLSSSPFVIVAQVAAVALSVWARRLFQRGQFSIHSEPKEGPLMSSGPYRFIRHPMYAAALLLLWSSILGHVSITTVMIGLVVTSVIAARIVAEERFLRARFPEYTTYSRTTKRIIPLVL